MSPPTSEATDSVTVCGYQVRSAPSIAELREAFGAESRMETVDNDIYIWDALGVSAYAEYGADRIRTIDASYGDQPFNLLAPKRQCSQPVKLGGDELVQTTADELLSTGFEANRLMPNCYFLEVGEMDVMVEVGNAGIVRVEISFDVLR